MMRTTYSLLFRVDVHHRYYATGRPGTDVSILPTPETNDLLRSRGFVVRAGDDHVAVYAEVTGDPPVLARAAGDEPLRFAFVVAARSPEMVNVTELPPLRLGRELICLDNLRADTDGDGHHLGDAVAATRQGPAVRLETGATLAVDVDPPAAATTVAGEDRFGDQIFTAAVTAVDPLDPLTEVVVEEDWARLRAGRYRISRDGDATTTADVYKGPGLERGTPLAVAEVFAGIADVPPTYRFLTGNQVTPVTYRVQFEPRQTTWRYVVVNKHRPAETDLTTLTVTGSTTFTRDVQGDRAVFTASARRAVSERDDPFTLDDGTGTLLDLPTPTARTPLEEGTAANEFVSPIYVYV